MSDYNVLIYQWLNTQTLMFFPIKSNHRHCGIENPSWAEIRHFVNFLDSQLQACEESSFCNMELVGDTLEGFRSFVVRFMILMSRVRYIFITRVTQFLKVIPSNGHQDRPCTVFWSIYLCILFFSLAILSSLCLDCYSFTN